MKLSTLSNILNHTKEVTNHSESSNSKPRLKIK